MNTKAAAAPAVSATAAPAAARQGLVIWAAEKFGVDAGKVFPILKQTCFKADKEGREPTDAEVAALMIVAREHGLNPFLKEIFAFPDKKGGIVPVVGVDGWIRIVNSHPQYDGVEFGYEKEDSTPAWIECQIYRKDRSHSIVVREFLAECKRETGPWKSHPQRMLRHKAFIQCARVAFGFAGIYDEDEAERIVEGQILEHGPAPASTARGAAALKNALVGDGINLDQTAGTAPAAGPAEPGGKKDQKPQGTAEILEKYLAQFKRCVDPETLSLTRDEARMYEWPQADQDTLDTAYSQRQDELARGKTETTKGGAKK